VNRPPEFVSKRHLALSTSLRKETSRQGQLQRAFPFQHGRRGRFHPHPRIAPALAAQSSSPPPERLSQATGIGNSNSIIDAEAELREAFGLDNGAPGIPARQHDINVRPISDQTRPVKLSP
jgi:hypothetical protein